MLKNKFLFICMLSLLFVIVIINSFTLVYAQQQQDNVTESKKVEFLSIQHAQSGSISENNATSYLLELNNVANETILFSDRPDRIVESIMTSDFVGNWTVGPNNFEADPPNAILVYDDINTGDLDILIIELFDPEYSESNNSLIYDITAINNISINVIEFGQSVLVIDETSDNKVGGTALCAGCGGRQCPPC